MLIFCSATSTVESKKPPNVAEDMSPIKLLILAVPLARLSGTNARRVLRLNDWHSRINGSTTTVRKITHISRVVESAKRNHAIREKCFSESISTAYLGGG